MKNITIAVGLAVITTSQFAVGIYLLVLVVRGKGKGKFRIWKSYVSPRAPTCSAVIARA